MSKNGHLLQDIINGLVGCLLRAKADMTSPSGKRLVSLLTGTPCQAAVMDAILRAARLALSRHSVSARLECALLQLELIVEARNLKKTMGFLRPELLAEYAKQVRRISQQPALAACMQVLIEDFCCRSRAVSLPCLPGCCTSSSPSPAACHGSHDCCTYL
jgi:hypothetical protein